MCMIQALITDLLGYPYIMLTIHIYTIQICLHSRVSVTTFTRPLQSIQMNRLNSDSIYSFENSRKFKIQQFLLNLIEFMSILSQSSVSLENEARG